MATTISRRTQLERRDESEARMLQAGVRLIAEGGLGALTLGDVGKTAGYSRGLPAHHFGTKEKFLEELGRFIIKEYNNGIEPSPDATGLVAVIEMIKSVFDLCQKNELFLKSFHVVLASSGRTKVVWDELEMHRAETTSIFERLLGEGIRKGEIRHNVNPKLMSFVIIQSISSVVENMLSQPSIDTRDLAKEVIEFIRRGLSSQP